MWVEVSTPGSCGTRVKDGNPGDGESNVTDDDVDDGSKGWWPYYKTWKVGLWMEDACLDLPAAEDLE